jgi:hypothetical protein
MGVVGRYLFIKKWKCLLCQQMPGKRLKVPGSSSRACGSQICMLIQVFGKSRNQTALVSPIVNYLCMMQIEVTLSVFCQAKIVLLVVQQKL